MSGFQGFPPELFGFFAALAEDNSKAFWAANKPTWEMKVRDPMLALLDDLAEEFGHLRMFRPNRDTRFSKDKSPYRLAVAAASASKAIGWIGYYIEVSATHLVTGYGTMLMEREQLERYRAAIDGAESGRDFADICQTLAARSLPVTPGIEPPLKRVPRGYPPDHPRGEHLRWKGAAVVQEFERAAWMYEVGAIDRIRSIWRGAALLKAWLDEHVGAASSEAGE